MPEEKKGNDVEKGWYAEWQERRAAQAQQKKVIAESKIVTTQRMPWRRAIKWYDTSSQRKFTREKIKQIKEEEKRAKEQEKTAEEERRLARQRERDESGKDNLIRGQERVIVQQPAQYRYHEKSKGTVWVVLVIIGIFILTSWQTGYGQTLTTQAQTAFNNLGIGGKLSSSINFFKGALNPGSYRFTNPDATPIENVQQIGVIIKNFVAIRPNYRVNENVKLSGTISVNNKAEDTSNEFELVFKCKSGDHEGKIILPNSEGNVIAVNPGDQFDFQILCSFDENTFEIDETKRESAEKVDLEVIYDYSVRSGFDIYVVDNKDDFGNNVDEVTDFFKKRDLIGKGNVRSNGVVVSTYQGGPIEVNLGFGSFGLKQPLLPSYYNFIIGLINHKEAWNGQLEQLESLKLVLAEGKMEIDEENCEDFDSSGILKKEVIDRISDPNCKSFKSVKEEFGKENSLEQADKGYECLKDFLDSSEYRFFCRIKVEHPGNEERPIVLSALTNYKYKISKSADVEFFNPDYKRPENEQ